MISSNFITSYDSWNTKEYFYAITFFLVIGTIGILYFSYIWTAFGQTKLKCVTIEEENDINECVPISPRTQRERVRTRSLQQDMRNLVIENLMDDLDAESKNDSMKPKSFTFEENKEMWLKSVFSKINIFSYVPKEFLEDVIRATEVFEIDESEYLFQHEQHDGSLYVVSSGNVLLTNNISKQLLQKNIGQYESVTSLLSLVAGLVDNSFNKNDCAASCLNKITFKLSAQATEKTRIVKVPSKSFSAFLMKFPSITFGLIQMSISRLQKVLMNGLLSRFNLAGEIFDFQPILQVETNYLKHDDILIKNIHKIARVLGITSDHDNLLQQLQNDVQLIECLPHEQICHIGTSHSDLYFVLKGKIQIYNQMDGQHKAIATIHSGYAFGLLSAFLQDGCIFGAQVEDGEDKAILLRISHSTFRNLLKDVNVLISCLRILLSQISLFACSIEGFFSWIHLRSGETLFNRGDTCDSMYTILSGRLRLIHEHERRGQTHKSLRDYGKGKTIGVIQMLTDELSTTWAYATRDSQLAQVPRNVLDYVVSFNSDIMHNFTNGVARLLQSENESSISLSPSSLFNEELPVGTITILTFPGTKLKKEFVFHYMNALSEEKSCVCLSSDDARNHLGVNWFRYSRMGEIKLSGWLGEVESSKDVVVYEADRSLTAWTKLSIRQADYIILLCDEDATINLSQYEKSLKSVWEKKNIFIDIVRIQSNQHHDMESFTHKKIAFSKLMKRISWLNGVHNIRYPFGLYDTDLKRLSRRILGRSIGLVLGGGGARGLAHIGVIKALEENGIPIDIVGGTSMGAFVAGIYAHDPTNYGHLIRQAKRFALSMGNKLGHVWDLTFPLASYFHGHRFNKTLQDVLGEFSIEDLLLNYYCVTTDVAKSRMCVHRNGLLWRYVRASMSLQGIFPPVSRDGSLLLDGGYMNNLPADIMKETGACVIIAVDVGKEPRRNYYSYGESLSGWWLLFNRLNPFGKNIQIPSMGDLSARLAYVSSEQLKARLKKECIDLYLRPPVSKYGTFDFDQFTKIIDTGYEYAQPIIKEWIKTQKIASIKTNKEHSRSPLNRSQTCREMSPNTGKVSSSFLTK